MDGYFGRSVILWSGRHSLSVTMVATNTHSLIDHTHLSTTPINNMESRDFLKELLVKRLRIAIKDGRVIDGHFMCTDNACNIVLSNCEEFLTQEDVGNGLE